MHVNVKYAHDKCDWQSLRAFYLSSSHCTLNFCSNTAILLPIRQYLYALQIMRWLVQHSNLLSKQNVYFLYILAFTFSFYMTSCSHLIYANLCCCSPDLLFMRMFKYSNYASNTITEININQNYTNYKGGSYWTLIFVC